MLTLSQKGLYGVSALFELALAGNEEPLSIKNIAKKQLIPEDYLRQLLIVLKKSKLVKSSMGLQGGYTLARHPSTITIRDIVESIDGEIKFAATGPKEKVLIEYWKDCTKKVKKIFDTTLEELVKQKIEKEKILDFNI